MALNRVLAALSLAIAGLGGCAVAPDPAAYAAAERSSPNSAQVRATARPGVPVEAYVSDVEEALRAADLDAALLIARQEGPGNAENGATAAALAMDDVAAGRVSSARALVEALPERYKDGVSNLVEPWMLLAEGKPDEALEGARFASARMPPKLGHVLTALVAESAGRLADADASYQSAVATLDLTPPGDDEPNSLEEAMRAINAAQTAQIAYRAALTKHRLNQREEAERLYQTVTGFARHAPDVQANLERLRDGRPPLEPELDAVRGMGRWALFMSEEFGRSEGLARAVSDPTPTKDLVSLSAVLLNQLGVAFDPSAHDWALGAAGTLQSVDSDVGALRLLERIPPASVFAADALLTRAQIALSAKQDDQATAFARQAVAKAPGRWSVAITAGRLTYFAGADRDGVSMLDDAVALASEPRERSDALLARAGAHFFAGRLEDAVADGRKAMAEDPRSDVRISLIGLLIDAPGGWDDAVRIGRELLAEKPESVARLNQLGYTLIQRPEGLDEGYRLQSRGVSMAEHDFAIVDSLGWAYYQYGDFDQALTLIERANDLSAEPVAEILDHLGDVYWRLRLPEAARDAWNRALAERPEARRRIDLERKLAEGLVTPAPQKRKPPSLEDFTPGQRSDL
jgi:tetratricopeptide (TPR) repeat protein